MKVFVFEHRETEATLQIYAGIRSVADKVLKAVVKDIKDWRVTK